MTSIPRSPADFLSGGGEMGERMRAYDWSAKPLGSPEQWPRSLKTAVRIMLTSRQAIWIGWGPELIYLYNDPYKSIIGGKHPEALGQPTAQVWREIWPEIGPRIERVMRDNEGTYDEALLLIMERYGYAEETYYTFSYSPVPDDDGGIGGLICANTPETERVLRERQLALLQRLAAETANARTLVDAGKLSAQGLATDPHDFPFAGVYLIDAAGDRMTLAGTTGVRDGDPLLPASAALGDDSTWPFSEAIAKGHAVVVERLGDRGAFLPHGAWDRPPLRAAVVPIAASGRAGFAGMLVAGLNPYRLFDESYRSFLDLTASQIAASIANAQTYEEEARRAAALAELDRAKTVFFSNVSHEFRTPLTLMLGPMEEALADPSASLTGEDLRTAHRNALRLLKLVNTLLDFSRIEAGRVNASYELTDIGALTRDLASAFRSAIEKAGLRFIVDAPEIHAPVYVDRDMWEKIVLNLLSNALKFTLDGEIELRLRQSGDALELTVRDSGSGIPAADLPHIFERFHRVEGTKRRTDEGTGIGLALVQELVKLHGGAVSATSVEGESTTFTITIPVGSAHLPAERVGLSRGTARLRPELYVGEAMQWLPTERESEPADPAGQTRPRVLLADDNPDMRDYIRRLLAPSYEVTAVRDGVEALRVVKNAPPDLVVTDVMMPNLDGFGLLKALRADAASAAIPVLLLSARAGEESRIEGFAAGADDYLVKPFAARELLARVSGLLALVRLRREADAAMRDIFMKVPAVIATFTGPAHVFQIANPMFMQLVGADREVLGRPIREAIPELEGQGWVELLDEVYTTGAERVGKGRRVEIHRHGSPEEFFFDFLYQPMRDGAGRVNGIFTHGVDVTAEVRARREIERVNSALRESEDELRAADRMKDEFLAMLSHELRTPLTAILGWTQILSGTPPPANEQLNLGLETINRSAKAQAQLIEDVLDVSRMTTGKMRLERRPAELAPIIESAVDTVRPAADAKEIGIRVALDHDIGPLLIDPDRFQQIVWNLLSNAIKFSPPHTTIDVSLRSEDRGVVIEVRDQGPGISRDFLPNVFHRFRQADSSSRRMHSGLGLGLALVKDLVELHGGRVAAESEEGRGALFRVSLPMRAAQTNAIAEAPLAGVRVLFVDDNAEARAMFGIMLEQRGAEVIRAASANEALDFAGRQQPHLVVTDIAMPERDGYDLLRDLQAMLGDRAVPVIALTAQRDEERARAAGFNGYLRKPIEAEALAGEVLRQLRTKSEGRRQRDEGRGMKAEG